jgi:hypothetical protein
LPATRPTASVCVGTPPLEAGNRRSAAVAVVGR